MINLDFTSRIPIYEQIVNEVERYVALKILKPGEQIASIRELALSLGINPNTVKKAYSILENKKVIQTYSTKGKIRLLISELEELGCSKDRIKKDIL